MRAAVFEGPGNVRVEQVSDPQIEVAGDAVVQVTHASLCGSDLWAYRGYGTRVPGSRVGHEFLGVVLDVGADVSTVKPGDFVVAPSVWSDGICPYCRRGLQTSCEDGGYWGEPDSDGALGEAVRVPYADGTLVIVPKSLRSSPEQVLPLAEVAAAGEHAVRSAKVGPGMRVAVIGDGAVAACAVLAARRAGAEQVAVIGHHAERLDVAKRLGATDTVLGRGDEAIGEAMSRVGAVDVALECVGTQAAYETAIDIVRDGGSIGYVGAPHAVDGVDSGLLFGRNIGLCGGVAPARAYLPDLLADVAAGTLDASPIFDLTLGLDDALGAYQAMDRRAAMKVLITVNP